MTVQSQRTPSSQPGVVAQANAAAARIAPDPHGYLRNWGSQLYLVIAFGAFGWVMVEFVAITAHRPLLPARLSTATLLGLYAVVATVVLALEVAVRTTETSALTGSTIRRASVLRTLAIATGAAIVFIGVQSLVDAVAEGASLEVAGGPLLGSLVLAAAAADTINIALLRVNEILAISLAHNELRALAINLRQQQRGDFAFRTALAAIFGGWAVAASIPFLVTQLRAPDAVSNVFFAVIIAIELGAAASWVTSTRLRGHRRRAAWGAVLTIAAFLMLTVLGVLVLLSSWGDPGRASVAWQAVVFAAGLFLLALAVGARLGRRAAWKRMLEIKARFEAFRAAAGGTGRSIGSAPNTFDFVV